MNTMTLLSDRQAVGTLDYLAGFAASGAVADSDLETAVVAAFARCCILTGTTAAGDPRLAAREAEAVAALLLEHPQREALALDPLLVLEHHKMLHDAGLSTPRFAELAEAIAARLALLDDQTRAQARTRRMTRLLAYVGIGAPPAPVAAALASPGRLLLESFEALAERIDVATANAEPLAPETGTILAMLALAELREYRLDLGAHLLRYLLTCGYRDAYVAEALAFIALQRTHAGSYGFVDPLREDGRSAAERETGFRLPVTLNAVWLLHLAGKPAPVGVNAEEGASA